MPEEARPLPPPRPTPLRVPPDLFDGLARAITSSFISVNVADANLEPANLVDVVNDVAAGLHRIAGALEKIAARLTEAQ